MIFEWYVSLDLLHLLLYINQTEHTVHQNRHQKYNQLTLDQFFYQVLIQSTFNKKNKDNSNDDNDDNHVQDVLASNQHQLLVPKGMNCTPRYQVDYAYAQGMLIMDKPWKNTIHWNIIKHIIARKKFQMHMMQSIPILSYSQANGGKNSNWKTICQHGLIFIKNYTVRYI